jgi:hypothetical protein
VPRLRGHRAAGGVPHFAEVRWGLEPELNPSRRRRRIGRGRVGVCAFVTLWTHSWLNCNCEPAHNEVLHLGISTSQWILWPLAIRRSLTRAGAGACARERA